jgi:hypothetical protein
LPLHDFKYISSVLLSGLVLNTLSLANEGPDCHERSDELDASTHQVNSLRR